jgi:hypothetical protein
MGIIMSEEIEALEKRLEKLEPLAQEALAAKILENWEIVKRGDTAAVPPVFPPICGDTRSVSPRSCCFASLSLGSAFVGAIVGAAAMFLGMTFFIPPKVEIREIVRDVRVKAEPEAKLAADHRPSPVEPGSENQSFEQPKAKKKWEDRLALSDGTFRDLDSLLAEREALARQMARHESDVCSVSSGFVPRRISPEEYRKLLRELKL